MKLFIDECLSPRIAIRLNDTGRHDAVHLLHVGRRGEPDHRVLAWCLAEEAKGDPADAMVNHVLEIDEAGHISLLPLP